MKNWLCSRKKYIKKLDIENNKRHILQRTHTHLHKYNCLKHREKSNTHAHTNTVQLNFIRVNIQSIN